MLIIHVSYNYLIFLLNVCSTSIQSFIMVKYVTQIIHASLVYIFSPLNKFIPLMSYRKDKGRALTRRVLIFPVTRSSLGIGNYTNFPDRLCYLSQFVGSHSSCSLLNFKRIPGNTYVYYIGRFGKTCGLVSLIFKGSLYFLSTIAILQPNIGRLTGR